MISASQQFQLGDIIRADFRTSRDADGENTRIQKKFAFQFRYQPARLAIGLSLQCGPVPRPLEESSGKPIKGDILFGSDEADLSLWVALICEHSGESQFTRRAFQDLVGAHWSRGMAGLCQIAHRTSAAPEALIAQLLPRGKVYSSSINDEAL